METKQPRLKIYHDESGNSMMQIAIITIVNKVLICRLSVDDWKAIKNGDKSAYNELLQYVRNAWSTTEACYPQLMGVDTQLNADDESEFQQCSKCDGHDACADFGCAYEAGLGHMVTK